MALSKTITANGSKGHHKFTLYVEETSTSVNTSYLSFTFKLSPVQKGWDWYGFGNYVKYNIAIGSNTYTGSIAKYDGNSTVTIKNASNIAVEHDADGTKTINVSFYVTDTSGSPYPPGNASSSSTFTLSVLHEAPTITNVEIEEIDATMLALNVPDDTIVYNLSKKQFTITADYKDSATLTQLDVYCENQLIGTSNSNIVVADFYGYNSSTVLIRLTDSLGGVSDIELTYANIPYSTPVLENTTIKRKTDSQTVLTDEKATLRLNGSYYSENNVIGNANTITSVEYKIWNTTEPSYTDITTSATIGSGNVTISNYEISSIELDKTYNYKIVITDYFGNQSEIKVGTVPTGVPIWTEFSDRVDFVKLTVNKNNPFEYLTSETKIGLWTNGKPIYRKVINDNTSSGDNSISVSGLNIDEIIKIEGTTTQSNNNIIPLIYYHSNTDFSNVYYRQGTNELIVRCGSSYGYGDTRIILEYTKTTD